MDTALPQKFLFILDRNLAKANCTGNRVCTSCDTVVLATGPKDTPLSRTFAQHGEAHGVGRVPLLVELKKGVPHALAPLVHVIKQRRLQRA